MVPDFLLQQDQFTQRAQDTIVKESTLNDMPFDIKTPACAGSGLYLKNYGIQVRFGHARFLASTVVPNMISP